MYVSPRGQIVLHGVVAPCYHHNYEVPQLIANFKNKDYHYTTVVYQIKIISVRN